MTKITNKDFPYFLNLLGRVKAAYPHIHGEVKSIKATWVNDCLNIQVALWQDSPTEELRAFSPNKYIIQIEYDPYAGGSWGPGGWWITDSGSSSFNGEIKGKISVDSNNDAYLKPHQTPFTIGFSEHRREKLMEKYGPDFREVWMTGYPDRQEWNGKRLLAGADYRIIVAD